VLDSHAREVRNELDLWKSKKDIQISGIALQKASLSSQSAL
jgi:hypothetical protein